MLKRLAILGAVGALGVLAWSLLATAASTKTLNLPAAAFVARDYSVHNSVGTPVCGSQITHNGDGENLGDLDNAEGSYFAALTLPGGAKVKSLSVFVNDNDGGADTHAYLIRKQLGKNLNPKGLGYGVMGHAQSSGAVNNIMRKFTDSTISGGKIDYTRYMYYVELVVCPITEPFAVRVTYTTG